jgi:glycosyltransferase A (GT-A) superfamily protein (DUF2064 family)
VSPPAAADGPAPRSSAAADGPERRAPASPGAPAALVIARDPTSAAVKPELSPLLGAAGCAALQALLIRRAADWAAAVAPGAAFFAVDGSVERVAELLPRGVTAFAQEGGEPAEVLAAAIARVGRGPLLIAGTDCPRLGSGHAAAALADLAAGCDVAVGATLEGGWYLAGLREPRPELLTVAPEAWQREGGFALVLRRAGELGAEVGMLRHERLLVTPADVAALLADPLLPDDLRAALS